MLAKVNANLPLLDVIRNVPAYVKFFKELASNKRKFSDNEKVLVLEVANSIMQQPLPPKHRDSGSFVINIDLGDGKEASSMLDLGLADRSIRYPRGIVEDVLVSVGGLIVPVDFVVLEIGEVHENGIEHTLLLGRPFMATTNTLIDVKDGTIKMTVLGKSMSFSVHDAIDGLVETVFVQEQECVEVFAGSADMEELAREAEEMEQATLPLDEPVGSKKPELELKKLPANLKDVFLEEEKEKPVIISTAPSKEQEDALLREVFNPGAVELYNENNKENFRVNGHSVKLYYEHQSPLIVVESQALHDPEL
ncbi:uncharacterized protein LOC131010325 [Salvia miltiorrhiza]|uniref:uncharacterized protein LOC131010325 n=1 Tax=Salvia miltiorrhiza TaxID=226208 RepID=UPI0025AB96D5|nr:uncharacterized protein LOC131010325 [Salvia miltiorrhiza]